MSADLFVDEYIKNADERAEHNRRVKEFWLKSGQVVEFLEDPAIVTRGSWQETTSPTFNPYLTYRISKNIFPIDDISILGRVKSLILQEREIILSILREDNPHLEINYKSNEVTQQEIAARITKILESQCF